MAVGAVSRVTAMAAESGPGGWSHRHGTGAVSGVIFMAMEVAPGDTPPHLPALVPSATHGLHPAMAAISQPRTAPGPISRALNPLCPPAPPLPGLQPHERLSLPQAKLLVPNDAAGPAPPPQYVPG